MRFYNPQRSTDETQCSRGFTGPRRSIAKQVSLMGWKLPGVLESSRFFWSNDKLVFDGQYYRPMHLLLDLVLGLTWTTSGLSACSNSQVSVLRRAMKLLRSWGAMLEPCESMINNSIFGCGIWAPCTRKWCFTYILLVALCRLPVNLETEPQ